jgi:hypothetical protein
LRKQLQCNYHSTQADITVDLRLTFRWYSSTLYIQSFSGAHCDTDHYLVLAKGRVRLSVSEEAAQRFDME